MHHHYPQPGHYLRGGGGRDGKTGRRSEVDLVRPEYDAVWSLTATVLFCGYIAKPIYIRVHIVITILLFAICMFSLVHVIVLEVFLTRHTTTSLHCIAEAQHNRLSSWLPAVIPVLLASVVAHIVTAVLLIITNL